MENKYLGTVKVIADQLTDDQIGPEHPLYLEKSPTSDDILIKLQNTTITKIPKKTSSWLSILLDSNKIKVQKVSGSTKNNQIYLFLQVYFIPVEFSIKGKDITDNEKRAWFFLADALGNRPSVTTSASEPTLPKYTGSPALSQESSNQEYPPNDSLQASTTENPRALKRSGTDLPASPASKVRKITEEQEISMGNANGNQLFSEEYMVKKLFENLNRKGGEADPPNSLCCTLRPYQKQALGWLIEREQQVTSQEAKQQAPIDPKDQPKLPPHWTECETACGKKYYYNQLTKTTHWEFPLGDNVSKKTKTSIRGGILADEMGMGKTVEILSLILSNTPHLLKRASENLVAATDPLTANGPARSTLVVCPLSVLTQWTQEITKYTNPGFISMYIYHGPTRKKDSQFLGSHDIVLTTYATLAMELPTEKKSKRPNKIEKGALLSVPWLRVVLDEAHTIKDRTTRTAKASFQLQAERRWCVTGTPIQNKLDDLFSLLHFLQVEPYCDYNWWNQIIMKPIRNRDEKGFTRLQTILQTILLRRTKTQKINNVPIVSLPPRIMKIRKIPFMVEEEDFYKALWDKAKTKFNKYVQVGTVLHNYAHILELLLRLRQACDHPSLVVTSRSKSSKDVNKIISKYLEDSENGNISEQLQELITKVSFNDSECLICLEIMENPVITPCAHHFCKSCIERELANSSTTNSSKCPVCNQPLTSKQIIPIPKKSKLLSAANNVETVSAIPSTPAAEDLLLSSSFLDFSAATPLSLEGSTTNLLTHLPPTPLPVINHLPPAPVAQPEVNQPPPQQEAKKKEWSTSSKIEALLQELITFWKTDPSMKSIVFSQWTSMLDLIEEPFNRMGIRFVRLDGSMSQNNREISVNDFNSNPAVKVFLISMKAGGLGLNLVAASTVFLLDPWWNPATEHQAIDRVHRLGQRKPVIVTRFIISGTIEERILELQDKKKRLVQGALGRQSKELREIRLEELRLLFRD